MGRLSYFGKVRLNGQNMYVSNTNATELAQVITGELTVNGAVCVSETWDIALTH